MSLRREITESEMVALEAKGKTIKTRKGYLRWQSVWLRATENLSAAVIGKQIGLNERTVEKHHVRYFKEGLAAFDDKPMGTRGPRLLSVEQEKAVLEEVSEQAKAGQVLKAEQIKPLMEEKAGKGISLGSVYVMLKRNGWSKKQPRPRHPKGCEEAKTLFKKPSRNHN